MTACRASRTRRLPAQPTWPGACQPSGYCTFVGLFEGYRDFVGSMWRGRGWAESETRDIMDRLVAAHEGMLRDIAGRFEVDDGIPGTLSKLANIFLQAFQLDLHVQRPARRGGIRDSAPPGGTSRPAARGLAGGNPAHPADVRH